MKLPVDTPFNLRASILQTVVFLIVPEVPAVFLISSVYNRKCFCLKTVITVTTSVKLEMVPDFEIVDVVAEVFTEVHDESQ